MAIYYIEIQHISLYLIGFYFHSKYVCQIIGNNVDIGCMCGIFGDITIGDNVKIGAGTILVKSVPDNCVVVGNPARIIRKDGLRVDLLL